MTTYILTSYYPNGFSKELGKRLNRIINDNKVFTYIASDFVNDQSKSDEYCRDFIPIFLCHNNIESVEQLNKCKEDTKLAIEELTKHRQDLRNEMGRCKSEDLVSNYKNQIEYISKVLKNFRKYIRLCEGIEERCKYFELFEKEKVRSVNTKSREYFR